MSKPRLGIAATRLLYEIAGYCDRYRRSPTILGSAASDVMDGWKRKGDPEVDELIATGVIRAIRDTIITATGRGGSRWGHVSTWELTDFGRELMSAEALR